MSGPIVVAVDFTEHAAAALVWAADAAPRYDAGLVVLHVVHDPESAPGSYARGAGQDRFSRIEDAARAMMDRFLEEQTAEHPELPALAAAQPKLVVGLPATRIVEVARALDATMIVVGSTGRTGLGHILLGSKAERVAQLAPMPVMIVKRSPPTGS